MALPAPIRVLAPANWHDAHIERRRFATSPVTVLSLDGCQVVGLRPEDERKSPRRRVASSPHATATRLSISRQPPTRKPSARTSPAGPSSAKARCRAEAKLKDSAFSGDPCRKIGRL